MSKASANNTINKEYNFAEGRIHLVNLPPDRVTLIEQEVSELEQPNYGDVFLIARALLPTSKGFRFTVADNGDVEFCGDSNSS